MSSKPWYRWFPGDYMHDTVHLSIEEDCLYRRLLDAHWRDGNIPSDPDRIRRLARFPEAVFEEAWPAVRPFFNKRGGRQNTLINNRMKSLLDRLSRDLTQKVNAGKARWNKELQASAKRTLCDPDPDPDPEEDKRREDPPSVSFPHAKSQPQNCRFAEWWEAYPKKTGKKPCAAIWKRRNLDDMADRLIVDVRTRAAEDAGWLDGYVPNPQTYLNQDRWEDEVNTERAKASNGRKTYDDYMQNLGAGVDGGPPEEILGGNVVAVRPTLVR